MNRSVEKYSERNQKNSNFLSFLLVLYIVRIFYSAFTYYKWLVCDKRAACYLSIVNKWIKYALYIAVFLNPSRYILVTIDLFPFFLGEFNLKFDWLKPCVPCQQFKHLYNKYPHGPVTHTHKVCILSAIHVFFLSEVFSIHETKMKTKTHRHTS